MIYQSREHLRNNKMTYGEHFVFASYHGIRCIIAGIYLICHAIVPAIFQQAGSDLVQKLNKSFTDHKKSVE